VGGCVNVSTQPDTEDVTSTKHHVQRLPEVNLRLEIRT